MNTDYEKLSMEERRVNFGQKLKMLRVEKAVSIDDLVHLTRIAPSFVDAIEAGQFDRLPGNIFGRGFMKNICKALEENPKEWIDLYDQCWPSGKKPQKKKTFVSFDQKQGRQLFSFLKKPSFWLLTMGVASGAFVISAWQRWRNHPLTEETQNLEFMASSLLDVEHNHILAWPVFDMEYPKTYDFFDTLGLDLEHLKVLHTQVSFNLQVKKPLKIGVKIDDLPLEEKTLTQGSHEMLFEQEIELEIGDTEGLVIYFNGQVYDNLHKFGKERKVKFVKQPLN